MAVGIAGPAGVEGHCRADRRVDAHRRAATLTVHDDFRVVISLGGILIVQSIRAAKSFWNAVRHRQIVA